MDDHLSDIERRVAALQIGPSEQSAPGTDSDLRLVALDGAAPLAERQAALSELAVRWAGEREFSELILQLLNDAEMATEAIAAAPPFDQRVIGRIRLLMDDPRESIWTAASLALARKKDHSILPVIAQWVRFGDAAHRGVGLNAVAFLLTPEPHLAFVESVCEAGPRDDKDEELLVQALRVAESRVEFWRKSAKDRRPPNP